VAAHTGSVGRGSCSSTYLSTVSGVEPARLHTFQVSPAVMITSAWTQYGYDNQSMMSRC